VESSLRERFAGLGPIRAVDRVSSGSPVTLVLRLPPVRAIPKTIDAMFAPARRGLAMLRAKRTIEALMEDGRIFVNLPTVEDRSALTAELATAGSAAAVVEPATTPDVRRLRKRLRLTREQFAARYGLEVETVRNWETGKREPDTTARSYLRAISNAPERVEEAYAPTASIH